MRGSFYNQRGANLDGISPLCGSLLHGFLQVSVRNFEFDCVLLWKFDRFARSTRHLLTVLEEFDHLGVRFISVQDQIDTVSPMGRAMAELGSLHKSDIIVRLARTLREHLSRTRSFRIRSAFFPQKADKNYPQKLGDAKSMIYKPFQ